MLNTIINNRLIYSKEEANNLQIFSVQKQNSWLFYNNLKRDTNRASVFANVKHGIYELQNLHYEFPNIVIQYNLV